MPRGLAQLSPIIAKAELCCKALWCIEMRWGNIGLSLLDNLSIEIVGLHTVNSNFIFFSVYWSSAWMVCLAGGYSVLIRENCCLFNIHYLCENISKTDFDTCSVSSGAITDSLLNQGQDSAIWILPSPPSGRPAPPSGDVGINFACKY